MDIITCVEIDDTYKKEYMFEIYATTQIIFKEFYLSKKNGTDKYVPFSYYSFKPMPFAGIALSKDSVILSDSIKQQAIKKAHELSLSKFTVSM